MLSANDSYLESMKKVLSKQMRDLQSPSDLRTGKVDSDAINLLHLIDDLVGFRIDSLRNLHFSNVHDGGKTPFGKNVDQDGNGKRIGKDGIFGIDVRQAGNGMLFNDWNETRLDQVDDLTEKFRMELLIGVQAVNK